MLNPPFWEKSLIMAIRWLKLFESKAMCYPASGHVEVGVIIAPTVYGEPENPGVSASPSSGTSTPGLGAGSALRWGMMVLNVAERSTGSSLCDWAAATNPISPSIKRRVRKRGAKRGMTVKYPFEFIWRSCSFVSAEPPSGPHDSNASLGGVDVISL